MLPCTSEEERKRRSMVTSLRDRTPERRGTALVLGAGGKLGRALRRALVRRYCRVVGVDRRGCDVTRPDHVAAVLDLHHPTAVFNAAAYNDVDGAEAAQALAFRVNALAPDTLAGLCRLRNLRLVHFSTGYVFPGRATPPYSESEPPAPLSRYGWSKAEGERAVLAIGREHQVVRVCGLYDEQGPSFVRTVLRGVLATGRVEVVADRLGSLTWVEPLARLVTELAVLEPGGIFHAVPPDVAPFDALARAVLAEAGLPGEVVSITSSQQRAAAVRPFSVQLDVGRLRELDLPLLPPWREGLHAFFAEHGDALLHSVCRELGIDPAAARRIDP